MTREELRGDPFVGPHLIKREKQKIGKVEVKKQTTLEKDKIL